MIGIYNDMSDLDAERIKHVVDSLEKVFDEDNSGTVGKRSMKISVRERRENRSNTCIWFIDINEFLRGFILTTKGDLQSKIEYTFRIYDQNNDQQISGEEIKKMASVIILMIERLMSFYHALTLFNFRLGHPTYVRLGRF